MSKSNGAGDPSAPLAAPTVLHPQPEEECGRERRLDVDAEDGR
jgi:hypothetical protein